MNRSNLEHVFFALLMQAAATPFLGWWAGAAVAIAFFAGREHAQREKSIVHGGHVGALSPLAGFTGWSRDSLLDVALPLSATVISALVGSWWLAAAFTIASGLGAGVWRICERVDRDMEGY